MTFVPGYCIQIIKGLIHSTKFIPYHFLTCSLIQRFEFMICPVGHTNNNLQSFLIVTVKILVYQSREKFMKRVPRCPYTGATDVTIDQFFRISTQIAVTQCGLYLRQAIHQTIPFLFELFTAGCRIHQAVGRKQVPCGVSTQFTVQGLPST